MSYLTETFIPYAKILTPLLLEGLWITIYISAFAFVLSVILGAILAIIQHFQVKVLSRLARVYVSYFRGTPLLIQLFLFYYGLPMVLKLCSAARRHLRWSCVWDLIVPLIYQRVSEGLLKVLIKGSMRPVWRLVCPVIR